MLRRHLLVAVLAAIVLLISAGGPAYGQLDQVFLSKGAPSRGIITAMGRDQIALDVSGVMRTIQVNEIARITYADEPSELASARNATLQRNYNQAAAELKKLEGVQIGRDLVRQDIEYYKALTLARLAMTAGGDKDAATAALVNFARGAQQNYHFYEAARLLGDLAMSSGKHADAVRYYGPLAAAPWPDFKMQAASAIGRALAADKKFDEALAQFESVLANEAATPEAAQQKLLATVGKATCLAETGKAAEAVDMLQEIINKNDPQDASLFARTYNALGACYLKLNMPKEALLAFLHTDILFSADADAHAESLYHLSKLWDSMNKKERAASARTTLSEKYAGSIWATLR